MQYVSLHDHTVFLTFERCEPRVYSRGSAKGANDRLSKCLSNATLYACSRELSDQKNWGNQVISKRIEPPQDLEDETPRS